MALPALTITVGGSTANSYVDLDDADDYADQTLDADAWDEATSPNRTRALLMAARRLDDENWIGERVTSTQALAWPRMDALKPDSAGYAYGYADVYLTTEIPARVKQAQVELAIAYLDGRGSDDGADESDISSLDIEGLSLTFRSSNPRSGSLPARVAKLIGDLVRGPEFVR